jgi:hypothetical protein
MITNFVHVLPIANRYRMKQPGIDLVFRRGNLRADLGKAVQPQMDTGRLAPILNSDFDLQLSALPVPKQAK